jgi:hypothetical protein
MLALFSGCVSLQEESKSKAPEILSIEFGCDRDTDTWSLRLMADAWTGDGEVIMATDDRIEIHNMDSIRAAPHGDGDELLMLLHIQADPDDSHRGSDSGFLCTEALLAALSMRASVFLFDSEEESDCWEWGPEKDFSPWGYGPCDQVDPDN